MYPNIKRIYTNLRIKPQKAESEKQAEVEGEIVSVNCTSNSINCLTIRFVHYTIVIHFEFVLKFINKAILFDS